MIGHESVIGTMRPRDAEKIRADALKMALTKAKTGCFSCAEGYLSLAAQNGASDAELQQIADTIHTSTGRRVSRRSLMKFAITGGVVAAAGGVAAGAAGLIASQAQVAAYWGTDSNTQACCGMPQNFYVGRLGYGAQPVGDPYYFNISASRAAGHDRTFGYWGVVGPYGRPSGMTSYDWGRRQADNAWNAWNHGANAQYLGGLTVFADVEEGFGGWINGISGANQDVLNGFLAELFKLTPARVWPGLYITPYTWRSYFGQGFRPATDFVLWLAGCDTCGGDICSPCNYGCNTLNTVRNRLSSTIVNTTLGGRKAVLWQYWISDCSCGDYNVMTQNVNSLVPVAGGSTYYSVC